MQPGTKSQRARLCTKIRFLIYQFNPATKPGPGQQCGRFSVTGDGFDYGQAHRLSNPRVCLYPTNSGQPLQLKKSEV